MNFFENGICLYRNRCQFSHGTKEIPFFSYKAVKKNVSRGNIANELYEIFKRPRLNVFKTIIKRTKKKKGIQTDIDEFLNHATIKA